MKNSFRRKRSRWQSQLKNSITKVVELKGFGKFPNKLSVIGKPITLLATPFCILFKYKI